jgi:CHAD domain-containing protein
VVKGARRAIWRAARDRGIRLAVGALALTGAAIAARRAATGRQREGSEGARAQGPSRAYRLRRNEGTADGIRRIAAGRTGSATDQLRGRAAPDGQVAVHEARKDLKKLRSLLRLARDPLGEELYRRENDRFRDAGRLLSGIRDAQVRVETLHSLNERFPNELGEEGLEALTRSLSAAQEAPDSRESADQRREAATQIEAGQVAIERWALGGGGWELIEDGLARSYRRGRARLAEVAANPSDENVHEWRKRVKDLWYHLRILARTWPEIMEPTANQAHELSDLLGDHHDLSVLRDHASLVGDGAQADDLRTLGKLIERRQAELLERAMPLGKRLYAEKPKAFRNRLASYWRAWR